MWYGGSTIDGSTINHIRQASNSYTTPHPTKHTPQPLLVMITGTSSHSQRAGDNELQRTTALRCRLLLPSHSHARYGNAKWGILQPPMKAQLLYDHRPRHYCIALTWAIGSPATLTTSQKRIETTTTAIARVCFGSVPQAESSGDTVHFLCDTGPSTPQERIHPG